MSCKAIPLNNQYHHKTKFIYCSYSVCSVYVLDICKMMVKTHMITKMTYLIVLLLLLFFLTVNLNKNNYGDNIAHNILGLSS